MPPPDTLPAHGLTVRETARYLRVSPARVRGWIRSGRLGAVNTADHRCGKPRWVILPEHLRQWAQAHAAAQQAEPAPRRRKRMAIVDYYPD